MKIRIGPYRKNRAVHVEIEPHDTWNMDTTLALIIHPMLVQRKATQHGAPHVDDNDVPDELQSTSAPAKANEWDTDDNYFKRWVWVLDEMIWAFEQKSKQLDAADMCADKCSNFGDPVCRACIAETQARLNNAFKLFGTYLEDLWD
jgi:hypothetical protein